MIIISRVLDSVEAYDTRARTNNFGLKIGRGNKRIRNPLVPTHALRNYLQSACVRNHHALACSGHVNLERSVSYYYVRTGARVPQDEKKSHLLWNSTAHVKGRWTFVVLSVSRLPRGRGWFARRLGIGRIRYIIPYPVVAHAYTPSVGRSNKHSNTL